MTSTGVAAEDDDGRTTWLALSAELGLLGCTCIAGMAQILSRLTPAHINLFLCYLLVVLTGCQAACRRD